MDESAIRPLIEHYGYIAVLLGSMLEGETVLLLAGFSAHRGILSLHWVVAVASVGGFAGDQFWYWMGRTHWPALARRFPHLERNSKKMHDLLARHNVWIIVAIRFMYGLRVAGPIVIGTSRVSPARFAVLNMLGAILWASLIGAAGYAFGQALEIVLEDVKKYESTAAVAIVALSVALWLYRRIRSKLKHHAQ